jgi:hypothetical protein
MKETTTTPEVKMSQVRTNLNGLIRGHKAQGAVGAALLAAVKNADQKAGR